MNALFLYYWRSLLRSGAWLMVLAPFMTLVFTQFNDEVIISHGYEAGFTKFADFVVNIVWSSAGLSLFVLTMLAVRWFTFAELELTLPLSRRQILVSRLVFIATVQVAMAIIAFTGLCVVHPEYIPSLIRYINIIPLISLGCLYAPLILIMSWMDYAFRHRFRQVVQGILIGVAWVPLVIFAVILLVIGPHFAISIAGPIFLTLAIAALIIAFRLYNSMSLSSETGQNFVMKSTSGQSQMTWQDAGDLPFAAAAMSWTRLFRLRTTVIMREAFGIYCALMLVPHCMISVGGAFAQDAWSVIYVAFMSILFLAAPQSTLRFFSALPMARRQLFRPVMLVGLAIILIAAGLNLLVPYVLGHSITTADLKVRTTIVMLMGSLFWMIISFGDTACRDRRPILAGGWKVLFLSFIVLTGIVFLTDWLAPFSRPIGNVLRPMIVTYFPWIAAAFAAWLVALFFLIERRFEKMEVPQGFCLR